MRRFMLKRHHDVSGVSGTGIVADGVVFPDGVTVIRWRGDRQSTVVWPSIEDVEAIHGHNGATSIEWLDVAPEDVPDRSWVTTEVISDREPRLER